MNKFNQDADNSIPHHVTSFGTYLKVAIILFALTILTVVAHQMHLGAWAAPVAFLIAAIKSAFVLLWFMHLKDDNMTNRVIFGTAFFALILLYAFSAGDIATRVLEHSAM